MHELKVKETKYDIQEIVSELAELIERFDEVEVSSDNYLFVENARKESFAPILDTYKRVLKESEEEYLLPYKNLVAPLKNALDKALEVDKRLKDEVLAEKKVAFKEEVRKEFYDLCQIICADGILPDFEEIYDEKWYQKNKKDWRESLLKKINDSTHKEENLTAYIVCHITRSQAKEIKQYLTERKISFRFEEIEEE